MSGVVRIVSGEIVDPKLMKDRDAVVSCRVCGFMLGEERILWCSSCCFTSVSVCDAWGIEIHSLESGRTLVLRHGGRWRGLNKMHCFMSGWGFVSGCGCPIRMKPSDWPLWRLFFSLSED